MPYTASNRRNRSLMTLPRWGQKVLLLAIIPVPHLTNGMNKDTQQTWHINPMPVQFWTSVVDGGPTPDQHGRWSRLPGIPCLGEITKKASQLNTFPLTSHLPHVMCLQKERSYITPWTRCMWVVIYPKANRNLIYHTSLQFFYIIMKQKLYSK